MDLIGKTPIHPFIFYTGKFAGYGCWIVMLTSFFEVYILWKPLNEYFRIFALLMASIGFLLVIFSLINLGSSTRLGLPNDNTLLKTSGLYRFSRNPMYLGFNILTLSAILYTWQWMIAGFGVYSIITYHLIIRGEEKFLKERFGEIYETYMGRVRRYI